MYKKRSKNEKPNGEISILQHKKRTNDLHYKAVNLT